MRSHLFQAQDPTGTRTAEFYQLDDPRGLGSTVTAPGSGSATATAAAEPGPVVVGPLVQSIQLLRSAVAPAAAAPVRTPTPPGAIGPAPPGATEGSVGGQQQWTTRGWCVAASSIRRRPPGQQGEGAERCPIRHSARPCPQPGVSAPGFRGDLINAESSGRNITNPQEGAEGYYQITGPTWQDFAPRAGVDLKQYPSALTAPYEIQSKVADIIPTGRWGPRTQQILRAKYGQLDPNTPMGQYAQRFGGPGPGPGPGPASATQGPPGPVDLSQMPTVANPVTGGTPMAMTPQGGAPATPIALAPQGAPPASLGDVLTRMAQSWQQRLNPQGSP